MLGGSQGDNRLVQEGKGQSPPWAANPGEIRNHWAPDFQDGIAGSNQAGEAQSQETWGMHGGW